MKRENINKLQEIFAKYAIACGMVGRMWLENEGYMKLLEKRNYVCWRAD